MSKRSCATDNLSWSGVYLPEMLTFRFRSVSSAMLLARNSSDSSGGNTGVKAGKAWPESSDALVLPLRGRLRFAACAVASAVSEAEPSEGSDQQQANR